MRLLVVTASFLMTLTNNAFAESVLDKVRSIQCKDLSPTKEIDVYFDTEAPGAQKYVRRPGELPFQHGNLVVKYGVFQTGVLILINDPQKEGGMFTLFDSNYFGDSTLLFLEPTNDRNSYKGRFTGHMDVGDGKSVLVQHRSLNCSVSFF